MEKRGSFSDQLAITKSAAWAWLEHRSGPDGRTTPEFYVSRTKFNAKPTRYKAEAERKVQENSNSACKIETSPKESIFSNGYYSLLDRYEIERISTQLNYYIESSRSRRHSDGDGHSGRRAVAAETKNKHGGKKVTKGLWLGSHAPLACGSSRGDVVDRISVEYSRRRRSSERRRAAPGEVVGCRPRPDIRN